MKRKGIVKGFSCIIVVFLVLGLNSHFRAMEQNDMDKLIDEMLEKSGAIQQISQLPEVLQVLLPSQMDAYGIETGPGSEFAQEMSEQVLFQHVDLYVNPWTRDLGQEGLAAIAALGQRARQASWPDMPTADLQPMP